MAKMVSWLSLATYQPISPLRELIVIKDARPREVWLSCIPLLLIYGSPKPWVAVLDTGPVRR